LASERNIRRSRAGESALAEVVNVRDQPDTSGQDGRHERGKAFDGRGADPALPVGESS